MHRQSDQRLTASLSTASPAACLPQQRLNENARLQRTRLRTRVLNGRTRLEAYPELEHDARGFAAEDFDYERVAAYLAEAGYVRIGAQLLSC